MDPDEIIYLLRAPVGQQPWRETDLYTQGLSPEFVSMLLERRLLLPITAGAYLQDDVDQICNLLVLEKSFRFDLSLVRPLFKAVGNCIMGISLRDVDLLRYSSEALNRDEEAIGQMLAVNLKSVFTYLRRHSR